MTTQRAILCLKTAMYAVIVVLFFVNAVAAEAATVLAQIEFPTEFGSDLFLASALVAFFLPAGIAAINRRSWSPEQKGGMAFLLCTLAGALVAYTQSQLTLENWLRSAMIILFLAIFAWNFFWKTSQIGTNIERATG